MTQIAAQLPRRRARASLAARMLLASAMLAVVVAAAFATLLLAVFALREATEREGRAKDVATASLELEKLVVDLETGLRGFVLTRNARFLGPWTEAREELPAALRNFERLAAHDPTQGRRARNLVVEINAYVEDYLVPLVAIARERPAAAQQREADEEGRLRAEGIRQLFIEFRDAEDERAAASATSANEESRRSIALAATGLVASAALIVGFGIFLARSIGRPVRRVAAGATRLAAGDFSLRLPSAGPGEVRELTEAFNSMAESLERSHAELEEQNEELRRSEQLKSDLVSIVSHEVRTPLASVLGFTSLLRQREIDAETRARYLEIIETQGHRLAALLDDFLAVQRIEEGQLELVREPVDVGDVLRAQVELFAGQSDAHRLDLTLRGTSLKVRGDAVRLGQVVANLLSNAIKYSPDGGVVEVVGERIGAGIRISVRDEGIGIPEKQREQIFTKFFRGDASASGITGTGLGLAFARAVVAAHGGHIDFTSAVGDGSTFWLVLPAAEGAARKER
jgi:signal transduction histidine kinase